VDEKVCQYCGSEEFEVYHQGPDGAVFSTVRKGLIKPRKTLNYLICIRCGTVKRIYISKKDLPQL
jgi:uncharacterized Zn finger protein